MKKITIGRGRECDIRLSDQSDKVSRRQAVITFTPFGRMTIYDTSANGTFVNGERVEKPDGKSIKRGDSVNFAHAVELDWSQVKNPYVKTFRNIAIIFTIAVVLAVGIILLVNINTGSMVPTDENETQRTDSVAPVDESLFLNTPRETYKNHPIIPSDGSKENSNDRQNVADDQPELDTAAFVQNPQLDIDLGTKY